MSETDKITGLGSRRDYVAPVAQVDPSRLTPDERQVLACIGRAASINDVLLRSGMDERKALSVLLTLRVKGIIAPSRVSRPEMPALATPAAPPPEPDPSEQVDLAPERRREILEMERTLDQRNHFEVLGLSPDAGAEEVTRAFHEASRRFHPDRYFGQNLGSYKARLERIFRRLSEANSVLSNPDRREAYLREHPELTPRQTVASAPEDPMADARTAERRARMARHPYLAQARQAAAMLAEAKALMNKNEFARATSHLQAAARLDPRNTEAPALLKEARRRHEELRFKQEMEQGRRLEAAGDFAKAVQAYRAASNVDPRSAAAAAKVAALMLRAGEDTRQAKPFAQRAVDLEPRNASYRVILGRILLDVGLKRLAKQEYEKALECDPNHAEAKEQLRKLRWTF